MLIPIEVVEDMIFIIRGRRVMIDRDLAELYGIATKALNQAVKRNIIRFPSDFMFPLNEIEKRQLVTYCDRFKLLKHSTVFPQAFTEHGVAMLSSVLKSEQAALVNIAIMRAFVNLRKILNSNQKVSEKLKELEAKISVHDEEISRLFEAINDLTKPEQVKTTKIGFLADREEH